MKTLIDHYAAYGHWANTRFVERLARESDAVLDSPAPSSFPSLRATLLHIRNAEHVWCCRLAGTKTRWPAEESTAPESLLTHAVHFHDHVRSLQTPGLMAVLTYSDLKGVPHSQSAWQMIMHCINHSTQHRGQLITQMRMLDLEHIPANDLVVFQRQVADA